MNAITYTEAHAVNTAASSAASVLQAADPSKHMILVPLSRLVLRPRPQRAQDPRMSIPELAASIQRVGLLQNLIVIASADGEHYEVVAGGRRLAALKLLAKSTASPRIGTCLACRWPMARPHGQPDRERAARSHAPGRPVRGIRRAGGRRPTIEDIAADFSVTPLVVQRRLKLANVSPASWPTIAPMP